MTPTLFLRQEFDSRKENNPRYSLRAFARDLGVSSGRLSEILNFRRRVTPLQAAKFAERLKLTRERAKHLQGCEYICSNKVQTVCI